MTNKERFELWWETYYGKDFDAVKNWCWAGFRAAAPPDDVRQACIEALREKEAMDIDGWGADGESAKESERYAAARKWLEGE